jgi:hypothetical protein
MASGSPPRPDPCRTLVCDTDALIQIFLGDQGELLKKLKRIYGIQSVISESVERELSRPGMKNSGHFQPQVRKAIQNQALIVLDEHSVGSFTSNDPHSTYLSIQVMGRKNNLHLGKGEAYSHAAGVVLRVPVMSNDMKAIVAADRLGLPTGKPTIRAYDVFVLFHQIGELSSDDCDEIRKTLTAFGESPHSAFSTNKFEEGLLRFHPRLVDDQAPLLATGAQSELADLDRLVLSRIRISTASPSASTPTLADVWPKPE